MKSLQTYPSRLYALLLVALAVTLSSCGWHIRGTVVEQLAAEALLQYESPVSAGLTRTLDRAFANSTGESTKYLVTVVSEAGLERIESLTDRLHTAQMRMEKRVAYRISSTTGGRIETGTALVWRDMDDDEYNPSSTEREKVTLLAEMDTEITQQILRHLERFALNNGDISPETDAD